MEENKNFDLDSIMDELSSHLEDMIENAVADHIESAVSSAIEDTLPNVLEDMIENAVADHVESAVASAIEDTLPNALEDILSDALNETLSNFEFVLPNGTVVRQRPRMKLVYPDKSKLMPCYGGLYIHGTCLMVQIEPSFWDGIDFPTKEDALAAFDKVKNAMNDEVTLLEL